MTLRAAAASAIRVVLVVVLTLGALATATSPAAAAKYRNCGVVRGDVSAPSDARVQASRASCRTARAVARELVFGDTWTFPDGATAAEDDAGRQWGCRRRSTGRSVVTTCRLYVRGGPSRSAARIQLRTRP